MKYLKSFKESYLESNFSPLYHYTSNLKFILADDILKRSTDYGKNILSISTMRNGSIINTMIPNSSYRIVLNQETLRDDGYTFRSYDAVGRGNHKSIPYDHYRISPPLKEKPYNFNVSSPVRSKVGGITTDRVKVNGMNLPFFGNEYEELILEDVKDLGNYIISIDISNNAISSIYYNNEFILEYIKKYPHIKLNEYYQKGNIFYIKPLALESLVAAKSKVST